LSCIIYLCVCFAAGIVTMIIVRTLRRDIAKYNKIEDEVSVFSVTLLFYCLRHFLALRIKFHIF